MKSKRLTALVTLTCFPVLASDQTTTSPATPAPTNSVPAETPAVPIVTKASSVVLPVVVPPTVPAPSFCGQFDVYRLFMNTEKGKQLQLQQQEMLRQAIVESKATETKIQPVPPEKKTAPTDSAAPNTANTQAESK